MKNANLIAREKRKTLSPINDFGIKELLSMPDLYDWVECSCGEGETFYMFLGGRDDGVALRFLWNGQYERTTLKAWSWFSGQTDGIIIDIGAHTGAYTLASLASCSKSVVISFEPHFMNFARLNLNLRMNNKTTRKSFMMAVGERNEILPFSISTSLDYLTAGGSIGTREGGFTTHVQAVALDSFFDSPEKDRVQLIKIDVEGYEGPCLRGMREIIYKNHPVIFFECISVSSGEAVQDVLSEYGYHFYEIDDQGGKTTRTMSIKPILDIDGRPIMSRLNRIAMPSGRIDEDQFV